MLHVSTVIVEVMGFIFELILNKIIVEVMGFIFELIFNKIILIQITK